MGNISKQKKKIRVGIYVEVTKVNEKTGISRHVIGLVNALALVAPDINFYLYFQRSILRKSDLDWVAQKPNLIKRPCIFPDGWIENRPRLWWNYYLPFLMRVDRLDLFHGPNHSVPRRGSIPSVVTIHDIAYFFMSVHGDEFDRYLKKITMESMFSSHTVISVSNSTANDCVSQGIPRKKIEVIYQGFDGKFQNHLNDESESQILKKLNKEEPYILSIGTSQPRKNLLSLVRAFSQISNKIPHKLVLAGPPGSDQQTIDELIRTEGLESRVSCLGYVSDNDKDILLNNADLFVYPSVYEGFGLVILEAMSYNVPVITGNNSALPEAAGDAAILVDVKNTTKIAESIEMVLKSLEVRKSLLEKGSIQTKKFSWLSCAQNTVNLYRKVLTND
jgi:glycosyltransferase involved in cell wall biosynthesis